MQKRKYPATYERDRRSRPIPKPQGQALIEYALIIALMVMALVTVLALTGPAIGNVFSNTVYNLLNATPVRDTLAPSQFWQNATAVASYTPPAITVYTWTPSGNQTYKPPKCTPYFISTPKNTSVALDLLSKCASDPIGQSLNVIPPNTPPTDPADGLTKGTFSPASIPLSGLVTYNPQANFDGYIQFTYTVQGPGGLTSVGFVQITVGTPSGSNPDTATPTPQPSSTPVDNAFSFPYYDAADQPSFWHWGFNNVVHGPWTVDYFNGQTATGLPALSQTRYWQAGVNTLDDAWSAPPGAAITSVTNFTARYTANNVKTEPRLYEIQLIANGPAALKINGTTVLQNSVSDDGTNKVVRTTYAGVNSASNTFVLTYSNANGAANVQLIFNTLADTSYPASPCNWDDQSENFHSVSKAWRSKFGSNILGVTSLCNLRLRGYIDIPANPGAPNPPATARLSFWEIWSLASPSSIRSLQVGVRAYNSASSAWVWVNVHNVSGASVNMNWKRQVFDLTNFGGTDFRGQRIEVAFRVNSGTDTNTGDIWAIDDLAIEPNDIPEYKVNAFTDPVNDAVQSTKYWINECNWARTSYQSRPGGTGWSWSDTPGDTPNKNYKPNDDCSLVLNGLVDLTEYATLSVIPELYFWSKTLLGPGATLYVEWQLNTDTNNWQALTPSGNSNPWVAKGTSADWSPVSVSLYPMRGKKIQLRLRLLADSNTTVDDGWYVTELTLRDRITSSVGVPFYEPFDQVTNWTFGGTWGLIKTVFYDTGSALTDSPTGQYGTSPSIAELNPTIDINGTANPVLTFWTQWDAAGANLQAQLSSDMGATWQTVWGHDAGGTAYEDVDVQKAWQRVKINLKPYLQPPSGTSTTGAIRVRFRIEPVGAAADGWYVDELRVEDEKPDVWQLSTDLFTDSIDNGTPKTRWYNGGVWDANNTKLATGQQWAVAQAWVSNSATALQPALSMLEWQKAFDLCGTTSPTLYFWNTYNLEASSKLFVDVSTDGGFTWPDPSQPASMTNRRWTASSATTGLVNLGWHRVQLDLTSYVPSSGACAAATKPTPIRIRFAMDTLASASASGFYWALDTFTVFDRKNMTVYGASYNDDFSSIGPGSTWITEGAWTNVSKTATPNLYGGWQFQPSSIRPLPATYDGVLTTTNWVGYYWHVPSTTTAVWGTGGSLGTNPTFPTGTADILRDNAPGELNYDYSISANLPYQNTVTAWNKPGTNNNEYYIMSWQRRYQTLNPTATKYRFRLRYAGGARIYISTAGGSAATARTTMVAASPQPTLRTDLTNPFRTTFRPLTSPAFSWAVDPHLDSVYFDYTFSPGVQYDVRVEYYHTTSTQSGPGKLQLMIAEPSDVGRTSPGTSISVADRYPSYFRTSLISNGVFTIPTGQLGNVSFNERWSLAHTDKLTLYYSLDDGFTWTQLVQHGPNNTYFPLGSLQDWTLSTFQIKGSGANGTFTSDQRVMIKFEIDSRIRSDANTDEGWYLDDFNFVASLPSNYSPPTATSWDINLNANTTLSSIAPSVTGSAGDSFRFTITSAPVRGWMTPYTTDAQGNIDFQYAPVSDWTGAVSFNYSLVSINTGASLSGVGTIQVNPKYALGLNVGNNPPSVTVPDHYDSSVSNTWLAWSGNGGVTNGTASTMSTFTPADAARSTMLGTYYGNSSTSNAMKISFTTLSSLPAGGNTVYTFFVYFVEPGGTKYPFDMFFGSTTTQQRLLNQYRVPAGQTWTKAGPFVVRFDSTTSFDLNFKSSTVGGVKVAGIELYKGADVDTWTVADVNGTNRPAYSTNVPGTPMTITAPGNRWQGSIAADNVTHAYGFDNGNFDIVAQVSMSSDPSSSGRAGVMVRDSNQANSAYAGAPFLAAVLRGSASGGQVGVTYRLTQGANSATASTTTPSSGFIPIGSTVWLRVSFDGTTDVAIGYYSIASTQPALTNIGTDDTTQWKQLSSQTLTMSSAWVTYSLATSANVSSGTNTTTAIFDNYQVIYK